MNQAQKTEEVDNIKLILEFLPLIAFFVTLKMTNFFWATVAIMVLTPIAIGYEWYKTKKISIPPLITLALVLVFGSITLLTKDSSFFQFKTTLLYILFAAVLSIGLLFKRNFVKMLMDKQITMTNENWTKLTLRLTLLFIAFAAANEFVRRMFSEGSWAVFKIMIAVFLMVFMVWQIYMLSPELRMAMEKEKNKD